MKKSWTWCWRIPRGPITLLSIGILSGGCGAVGPPIPPEEVGIEAKAIKQRENALKEGKPASVESEPTEEEKVQLPSFYPIGTR